MAVFKTKITIPVSKARNWLQQSNPNRFLLEPPNINPELWSERTVISVQKNVQFGKTVILDRTIN